MKACRQPGSAGDINRNGKDALGYNAFMENLRRMIGDIATNARTLTSSSGELSSVSGHVTAGARKMSERAQTIAAAAEEASANTAAVAANMDRTTASIGSVASATEQMTATVGEIASNSEQARDISGKATEQARAVSAMMKELGRAAYGTGGTVQNVMEGSPSRGLPPHLKRLSGPRLKSPARVTSASRQEPFIDPRSAITFKRF